VNTVIERCKPRKLVGDRDRGQLVTRDIRRDNRLTVALRGSVIVPYRRFVIETLKSPPEILDALESQVEQGSSAMLSTSTGRTDSAHTFVGELSVDRFKIRRKIGYRNSFLPMINGVVTPMDDGARVVVTIMPHVFVVLFMCVWMSIATFAAVAGLTALILHGDLVGLATLILPAFGTLLMLIGFVPEAKKGEIFIRALIPPKQPPYLVGPYR